MEVVYSVDDLTEDAVDFWTGHFSGHDDGEEVVGGVFHDLGGGGKRGGRGLEGEGREERGREDENEPGLRTNEESERDEPKSATRRRYERTSSKDALLLEVEGREEGGRKRKTNLDYERRRKANEMKQSQRREKDTN